MDLSPGTYSVTISYTGLETKEITDIVIKKGAITRQDIVLGMKNTEKEVIVTASAKKETVGVFSGYKKITWPYRMESV